MTMGKQFSISRLSYIYDWKPAMSSTIISMLSINRATIQSLGEEAEARRRLPETLVDLLVETEIFAILQPKIYGGLELPMLEALEVIEALSSIDGAVGWCLLKGCTTNQLAGYVTENAARRIWGRKGIITGGSFNPKGKASRVDGGYRLSGRWDWGTGTTHSHWILCGAIVIDPITQSPIASATGGPMIKSLFVPRADVTLTDTWHTHGMRGTGSVDFCVDDIFVPDDQVLDGPMAKPQTQTAYSHVPLHAQVMVPHAAVAIGIAENAFSSFVRLAQDKTPLMSKTTLAANQLVQDGVGRARANIDAARAYVRDSVCRAFMADAESSTYTGLSLSATHATHSCIEAVDILYKLAGGSAVFATNPIQRCWRDIHVAGSHFLVNNEKYAANGQVALLS